MGYSTGNKLASYGGGLMGARGRCLGKTAFDRLHSQAPFERSWSLSPAQAAGQEEGTPPLPGAVRESSMGFCVNVQFGRHITVLAP